MLGGPIVDASLDCKKHVKQSGIAANGMRYTVVPEGSTGHVHQPFACLAECVILAGAAEHFHRFQPGGRSYWIAGQCAHLHQPFVRSDAPFVEMRHDVRACTQCRQRKPAANDLSQRADVRNEAETLLLAKIKENQRDTRSQMKLAEVYIGMKQPAKAVDQYIVVGEGLGVGFASRGLAGLG